jgi:hypothetical protein
MESLRGAWAMTPKKKLTFQKMKAVFSYYGQQFSTFHEATLVGAGGDV